MLSQSAFRYYELNKDIFQKFDKNHSLRVSIFFYYILWVTGISSLVKLILVKLFFGKIKFSDNTLSILMTHNHLKVDLVLHKYLKSNFYSIAVGFKNKNVTNSFGDFFIFFCTIAKSKKVIDELNFSQSHTVLKSNSTRVIKLVGLEFLFQELFRNDIKKVIKYNDHSPYSILLHDIAKENQLKTIYVQHAPVSKKFPALYHDYNVLFSRDSLEKYNNQNDGVKVFTFFDIRFLEYDIKLQKNDEVVLICPNILDDVTMVVECATILSDYFKIIIRPHPADKRNWALNNNFIISREKDAWRDIYKCTYLLTNESAITLEGIFANRLCFKCAFFSSSLDSYGFIKNRLLTKEYHDNVELLDDIKSKYITYDKTKLSYYIGDFENKDILIKKFDEMLNGNFI